MFKCSVYGCRTNYKAKIGETREELSKPAFDFPSESDDETFLVWVKFVNRQNYKVTASSRICIDHFDEKFINSGQSRMTLHRDLQLIPTMTSMFWSAHHLPNSLTPSITRKPPKERPAPPNHPR